MAAALYCQKKKEYGSHVLLCTRRQNAHDWLFQWCKQARSRRILILKLSNLLRPRCSLNQRHYSAQVFFQSLMFVEVCIENKLLVLAYSYFTGMRIFFLSSLCWMPGGLYQKRWAAERAEHVAILHPIQQQLSGVQGKWKSWAPVSNPAPTDHICFHGHCNQAGPQRCGQCCTGCMWQHRCNGRSNTVPGYRNVQHTTNLAISLPALFYLSASAGILAGGCVQLQGWRGTTSLILWEGASSITDWWKEEDPKLPQHKQLS